MSTPVAAVVPIRDVDRPDVEALVGALAPQAEVVLIDATHAGDLEVPGATIVREPSLSRGHALLAGLAATDADWILWAEPGSMPSADRVEVQLAFAARCPDASILTSDLAVVEPTDERQVAVELELPAAPAFWRSGVLIRREALARIDTTCFAPAELKLLEELRKEGAHAHLPEALVQVPRERWEAAEQEARSDARLLELSRAAHRSAPLVTVLLACHERMDVLPDCLAGFARQLVPPGTLEIVVCDDGSTDGTVDFLSGLDLAVPFRFTTGPNGGACAARNRGLDLIRGRYVLFVNDDTVPAPDLVQRHLEAHRALGDPMAGVLGTFEQPPAAMELALTRVLEHGTFVFGYPDLEPGQVLGGSHFYTCNVSVPAEAVRAVGRFDEDFPWYTEDTEFGVRLEQQGYSIHYRPEARAWHHHTPTFEAMQRRQPAVARAHVRLFQKHPHLVDGGQAALTAGAIRASHRLPRKHLPELEAALRTLAGVNLARLEEAEGATAEAAQQIEGTLAMLFGKVNTVWWHQGIEAGLNESGLRAMADLAARCPITIDGLTGPLVLLHPSNAEAGAWLAAAETWLTGALPEGLEDAVLGVIAEPTRGLDAEVVRAGLEGLVRRCAGRGETPHEFVVLETEDNAAIAARLLAGAYGWLTTGAGRDAEDRGLALSTNAIEIDGSRLGGVGNVLPLAVPCAERLLTWPAWDDPQRMSELARTLSPLAISGHAGVVLLFDEQLDGDFDQAVGNLREAWRTSLPSDAPIQLSIEVVRTRDLDWPSVGALVDAVVIAGIGDAHADALKLAGVACLEREDVAPFLQRERAPVEVPWIRVDGQPVPAREIAAEETLEEACHA